MALYRFTVNLGLPGSKYLIKLSAVFPGAERQFRYSNMRITKNNRCGEHPFGITSSTGIIAPGLIPKRIPAAWISITSLPGCPNRGRIRSRRICIQTVLSVSNQPTKVNMENRPTAGRRMENQALLKGGLISRSECRKANHAGRDQYQRQDDLHVTADFSVDDP